MVAFLPFNVWTASGTGQDWDGVMNGVQLGAVGLPHSLLYQACRRSGGLRKVRTNHGGALPFNAVRHGTVRSDARPARASRLVRSYPRYDGEHNKGFVSRCTWKGSNSAETSRGPKELDLVIRGSSLPPSYTRQQPHDMTCMQQASKHATHNTMSPRAMYFFTAISSCTMILACLAPSVRTL